MTTLILTFAVAVLTVDKAIDLYDRWWDRQTERPLFPEPTPLPEVIPGVSLAPKPRPSFARPLESDPPASPALPAASHVRGPVAVFGVFLPPPPVEDQLPHWVDLPTEAVRTVEQPAAIEIVPESPEAVRPGRRLSAGDPLGHPNHTEPGDVARALAATAARQSDPWRIVKLSALSGLWDTFIRSFWPGTIEESINAN